MKLYLARGTYISQLHAAQIHTSYTPYIHMTSGLVSYSSIHAHTHTPDCLWMYMGMSHKNGLGFKNERHMKPGQRSNELVV